jgi:hypothetical protein
MISHHIRYANHDAGVCLIGIAAHVYADTFAHFGFSGVGSRRNKVDNNSFVFDKGLDPDIADYIKEKEKIFFRKYGKGGGFTANIKSWLAETVSGAIGHGAVATYPDRPYLKWSFEYEYPKKERIERNNPKDFLDGCQALHSMFTAFGEKNPTLSNKDGVGFSEIKNSVASIIRYPARKEDRVKRWRTDAKNGKIGPKSFQIPLYNPEMWLKQSADMNNRENSISALKSNLYRFYQAASIHRQFVLRELLPNNKLVVA